MSNELALLTDEHSYLEVAADHFGGGGSPYNAARLMVGPLGNDNEPDWSKPIVKMWVSAYDIDRLITALEACKVWMK